jgi:WD40 repeat protein/predicted Ser/Thr protein kinase
VAVKCPTCHSDNTDTARFCSNCATALGTAAAAVPPAPATTPSPAPPTPAPPRSFTRTLKTPYPAPALASGTVLAARYEILAKIGEGGMGEVHRALDRNLGRHVAIKLLPAAFADDQERLARFEREARLLAVLNHPHIATIYGLEGSEGHRFIAMELVEGEALKTRLDRGPLEVGEALELCRQIAEGLEAAHEKGIVHRDLKPGNILITPEGAAKILDFGLAKAYAGETTGIDIANSPTITARMTEPGVILGTAAYMSPEQARGRSVDKRADIWAFGCVLYECLTGKRPFQGETVSDTLAQILTGEPDWAALPPNTPPNIAVLLRRCLQKHPRNRLHDIADARLEIEAPAAPAAETAPLLRRLPLPWLAGGAAVVLLAGILIGRYLLRHPGSAPSVPSVTATIKVEPGHWLAGMFAELWRPSRTAMAVSSDGRFVVYSAIKEKPGPDNRPRLFLRRLDRPEARPIAGTEGGINPFLSPDNRWVGFWADGALRKISIDGGVANVLCDAREIYGASWGRDNTIAFAVNLAGGMFCISAEGGKPETLTTPDPTREETSHRLPSWLPDGKSLLFTVTRHFYDLQPRLALLRIDTREWRILLEDAADARYVPTGHLIFLRRGTLMAVRFDLQRQEIIGQPAALVQDVMQAFSGKTDLHTGAGQFSISDTGSLIYAEGGVVPDRPDSLVWVDTKGNEEPVTDLRKSFLTTRLSPDGQRIAYCGGGSDGSIWVYDLERGTNRRLTEEGQSSFPLWSPDGKMLLFSWHRSLSPNLFGQPHDGSRAMERMTTSDYRQYPGSWTSDGKTVAFVERPETDANILFLDVASGRVTTFLDSKFDERYPDFSPDGRWIAYSSDEAGRDEVYVRPFPGPGTKHLVSAEGGSQPMWARDGSRLFYRQQDQYWVVDVRTDGGFSTSKPRLLFTKPGYGSAIPIRSYDLSVDSQRFLMIKSQQRALESSPATEMILVQNWFEELKRMLPNK